MDTRKRLLAAIATVMPGASAGEVVTRLLARDESAEIAEVARALGERVKELTALHGVATLLEDPLRPEAEVLGAVAALLPPAMLYSDDAAARLVCGAASHATAGFSPTPWTLRAPFATAEGIVGAIEVAYRHPHPDEAEGPFLAEERHLVDSLARMVGVAIERRRASERLRLLVAQDRVRIFEWDVTSNRITWPGIPDPAPEAGGRARSMTRSAAYDAIHPDDRDHLARVADAAVAGTPPGGQFSAEYRAAFRAGEYRWRHLTGQVVRDASGRATRVIGISIDITEQRALQDRLRQGQKMEALGLLAGSIAHDFNNILAGMLGFAELAQRQLRPGEPALDCLSHIVKAGDSAAVLIRQILAFGRRQELRPAALDLRAVVAETEGLLAHLVGKRVRIGREFAPEPTVAFVDANQVQQVLLNLAANARDAMPEGGTLTLAVRGRQAPAPLPDGRPGTVRSWAVLEVADSGCGMPPEVRQRIFEPFFTTKPAGKGTGLGLATVHGIVTQSGGFLEVESEVGHGTRFRVHFPPPA